MKTSKTIDRFIRKYSPCIESIQFLHSCTSLADAWNKCPRGDWLLWGYANLPKADAKLIARCNLAIARRVLPIFKKQYPEWQADYVRNTIPNPFKKGI